MLAPLWFKTKWETKNGNHTFVEFFFCYSANQGKITRRLKRALKDKSFIKKRGIQSKGYYFFRNPTQRFPKNKRCLKLNGSKSSYPLDS